MQRSQLDLLDAFPGEFRFRVRQSQRARQMAVTVSVHGLVEVVVPVRSRPAQVEEFVTRHRQWIDQTLAWYQAQHPGALREPAHGLHLAAIGQTLQLQFGARHTRQRGQVLEVAAAADELPRGRDQVRGWLQRTGRKTLVPWLQQVSQRTGLRYSRVQVRGQKTRWGSFSSNQTLSLNYFLLFLEPALVEQVLIHELCHSRHLNHSASFWRLVARHAPGYRDCERRLNEAWREIPAWLMRY